KARMPALRNRKDSEWNIDRHRNTFELRVNGSGNRQLLVDQFHLIGPESKMRRVQIAGRKLPAVSKKLGLAHFLHALPLNVDLALLRDGTPAHTLLRYGVVAKL